MKFMTVRDAKTHLSACLEDSQREGVVVTNHGRPKSVVIGVDGYDMEDVMLMLDPDFWSAIESRRKRHLRSSPRNGAARCPHRRGESSSPRSPSRSWRR